MASQILRALRTWVDGYDLTGDANTGALDLDHEVHDVTVFQPPGTGGARARACGHEDVAAQSAGFWATGLGSVDADAFTNLGRLDTVMTMSPDGLEGSVAYMMRTGRFKYSLLGQSGRPAPFSLDFRGSQGETAVVRGQVTKTKAVVAATGATGTPVNLGAAAAGQYLYASLHAFTAGTSITVQVQSATDQAFTTGVTSHQVIGSGPITAVGGYWTRLAGPVTGPWYRVNVTAITGSFTLAALAGIR